MMPICTLVNGVRQLWEAVAMNSDLSRFNFA